MENDNDDDFMCIRVGGGKTIATCKDVTVVASMRTEKVESHTTEEIKSESLWRRIIIRLLNTL